MSNDYEPIRLVRSTHEILHLNPQLQQVDNTFNITTDSFWNDYSRSLLPIPAICAALGLIAVIVMQMFLCASLCCSFLHCNPHMSDRNPLIIRTRTSRYTILSVMFFISAILTVLIVQTFFIGRSYITHGVHQSEDTVDYISNLFNDLIGYGNTLSSYGVVLQNDFQSAYAAGCQAAQTLESYIPTYNSYVDDYASYVDPVPNQVNKISDKLDLWGIKYQNYTIWALYFIILIGLVFFFLGYWRKSKIIMRIGIGLTELILIPLFLLVGLEMVILMGLSDFCMDPVEYALPLAPSDIYNLTSYYATCTGVNPLASIVSESETFLNTYQQAVQGAMASCPGNTYLGDALITIQKAEYVLTNITTEISCPPTQSQILDLLQTNVCDQTFRGFYVIWIGQYLSSGLLLLTTIIIAIIYQFFGAYWNSRDESSLQIDYTEDIDDSGATAVPITLINNPAMRKTNVGVGEDYTF